MGGVLWPKALRWMKFVIGFRPKKAGSGFASPIVNVRIISREDLRGKSCVFYSRGELF